jgi:hypothetical protein
MASPKCLVQIEMHHFYWGEEDTLIHKLVEKETVSGIHKIKVSPK